MIYLIFLLLPVINIATTINSEEALQEFINGNNLFAASFYKQIGQEHNDSFLISPYSAAAVLAFLHSGCKGETAQEIRQALRLSGDKDKVESLVNQSISQLKGNEFYKLSTANKMYVKEKFPINDDFKKAATDFFHAGIENINFVPQEAAAKTMNDWVEEQTNNKIKNLIKPDALDESTVTVLINAVYFKGNWSHSFPEGGTRKKDFYKTKQDVAQVDTMHLEEEWFNYSEDSELDAQFLEMPFQGEEVSMVIVLPNKKDGLAALESQIEKVFAPQQFKREFLNIQLPKFKIESRLPLVEKLKNLGIRKSFDPTQADLSGIAAQKGDLVVSDVLQQTYINVEENGVEAAAATYIAVVGFSALVPSQTPKEFIVDHPFIFYIKAKDFIIFAGRYLGPD